MLPTPQRDLLLQRASASELRSRASGTPAFHLGECEWGVPITSPKFGRHWEEMVGKDPHREDKGVEDEAGGGERTEP